MSNVSILELLKNVQIKIESFREAKRLYGNKLSPDFFVFDYLRDDEMGLSVCIGDLLRPNGKHGQGNLFLNSFLIYIHKLLKSQTIENSEFDDKINIDELQQSVFLAEIGHDDCNVTLEKSIDNQRRIDIYLTFSNGEIIGIENKPWAEDQKNQLKDYASFIKKQSLGKSWLLIYLCNEEPSEDSISKDDRTKLESNGNLITISYSELVEWLNICCSEAKSPILRFFIEELIKYINRDINGVTDMSLSNEIKKIIIDDKKLEAAMHVSKAINGVKIELLTQLKRDLDKEIQRRGFGLSWKKSMDGKWSSFSGFGINFDNQFSFDLELWFEFQKKDLNKFIWGVRRKNSIIISSEIKQNINKIMSSKYGSGKQSTWWPWWSDYEDIPDMKNWENSVVPWNSISDGSLVQDIIIRVNDVYQIFSGLNKLSLLKNQDS